MKNREGFLKELSGLKSELGFDLSEHEQGSDEWMLAKCGVVSASRVHDIIARKRNGDYTAARETYMKELISQVMTGELHNPSSAAMRRGRDHEAQSRASLALAINKEIEEVPIIYNTSFESSEIVMPHMRTAASPDGLICGLFEGAELKNPYNPVTHYEFIADKTIKPEYITQCMFSLWATRYNAWYFASNDMRFKIKPFDYARLKPCLDMFDIFQKEVTKFLLEMDRRLALHDIKFGLQWQT